MKGKKDSLEKNCRQKKQKECKDDSTDEIDSEEDSEWEADSVEETYSDCDETDSQTEMQQPIR